MVTNKDDVTRLLLLMGQGNREAESQLIEIVFPHLRRLARRYLRQERPDHTLQATALVHEAYLRLVRLKEVNFQNHVHFFAIAARLMRQILVDHARARNAGKRSVGKVTLDESLVYSPDKSSELLALDEALSRLNAAEDRLGQIVELRFFGGLTFDQIGQVLGVSERTVKRDWQLARAWLLNEIEKG